MLEGILPILSIILTVGSTIVMGILQYKNEKRRALAEDKSATSNLIDSVLKINKQEVDVLRELNEDLINTRSMIEEDNKKLRDCQEASEERIRELIDKYEALSREYENLKNNYVILAAKLDLCEKQINRS